LCIHIFTYTYIYIYIAYSAHQSTCMHDIVCIHIFTYICMILYAYKVYTNAWVYIYVCVCVCVYIYIYIYIYVYIYIPEQQWQRRRPCACQRFFSARADSIRAWRQLVASHKSQIWPLQQVSLAFCSRKVCVCVYTFLEKKGHETPN
jgi:hypothetical protein